MKASTTAAYDSFDSETCAVLISWLGLSEFQACVCMLLLWKPGFRRLLPIRTHGA